MCGIAAALGIRDPAIFRTLFDPLAHRGPDQRGVAECGDVRIGTHRLSIVGEEEMALPLTSADGRFLLAFNGEIYNHRDLRDQFCDYSFRTGSDGEVIFPLIERHGPHGIDCLRGMFAFVLVEAETGKFIAARDPLGIKPLYYARHDGGIAFASELKSLAPLPVRPTFLPPGHFTDGSRLTRYYRLPGRFSRPRGPGLRCLLERAVRSHLPETGPCGVFLSGGLDSSIVAALAARQRPDIVAYTVVLPGSADEEPAAEVARHLGIRHKVLHTDEDQAATALAPAIGALESFNPVMVRNAIPLYLLAQFVGADCKVILGGDGSDELFAGYDYLPGIPRRNWPAAIDAGINNLHRTELQRVDRMTMAHGIELRVPFLDRAVAEAAIDLPLESKIGRRDGRMISKLALREAAADLLPPALCWREKLPLVDGSGFSRLNLDRFPCGDAAGWDLPDDHSRRFFPIWNRFFPNATPDVTFWTDAGRYGNFKEDHGQLLLGLFRE